MNSPAPMMWRRIMAAAWRIALVIIILWGCLVGSAAILPAAPPSEPRALLLRIAAGIAISAVTLILTALLIRYADHRRLSDAGITDIRTGWRLALGGAALWLIPAAITFAVLALLGAPLTITVSVGELVGTVLLLFIAVLVSEAIPEEVAFRGYITTVLSTVQSRWWVIITQVILFTLFAGVLRQEWNPVDLSLFLTMGIGFGYLRMITGSLWMPLGFHVAFQTGAQLVLTHEAVAFAGGAGVAMLALGVIPFTVAGILITTWLPRQRQKM